MADFKAMKGLTFQDQPRAVRIWDESIIPADARVMTRHDIEHLKAPLLKSPFRAAVEALDQLAADMEARVRDSLIVPHIELPDPRDIEGNPAFTEADRITIENLVAAAEGRTKVRQDPYKGTVTLHYEEVLPQSFEPLLVLGASGELRLTYKMWEVGRHNLTRLKPGYKTYANLTVRHWDRAAGKTAHVRTDQRRKLAQGVAEAVADAKDDEILIIVRKPAKPSQDMEAEIRQAVEKRMAVEGREPPTLHFRTWGTHTAVNDYAHVKHVIVVGLLIYGSADAEAMARASGGLGMDEEFGDKAITAFSKGEIAHHVFQAVGRGAIRKVIDEDVPKGCKLDIVFSTRGNAHASFSQEDLQRVFPEATITDWETLAECLKPNEKALVQEIYRRAMDAYPYPAPASWAELSKAIGLTRSNIWQRLGEPRVATEPGRLGLVLHRQQGKAMQVQKTSVPRRRPENIDELRTAKRKQKLTRAHRRGVQRAAGSTGSFFR